MNWVFSKSPKEKDKNITFVHSDIEDKVNTIKQQPGKGIWLYDGAGLITSFMNVELVDNYLLAVYPVIVVMESHSLPSSGTELDYV